MYMTMRKQRQAYSQFASVLDQSAYEPLPDGWLVGTTDIVDSTRSIRGGRYQDVNFVGVSIIAALGNSLGTFDFPFTFGGDGAAFAVPGEAYEQASNTMRQVQALAQRQFGLSMRAGLFPIGDIRANGRDVRIARYAASSDATYTMFSGGGIRWVEHQLKLGQGRPLLPVVNVEDSPDLTGLSCNWNPFVNRNGTILSLVVESRSEDSPVFVGLAKRIVEIFDGERRNSVPAPETAPARRGETEAIDPMTWSAVVSNSDFRKYDDALRLTVDCSLEQVEAVKAMLRFAARRGEVAYGLHCQSHAIMTCFVPSSDPHGHRHFLDGLDGGYSKAAAMLRAAA